MLVLVVELVEELLELVVDLVGELLGLVVLEVGGELVGDEVLVVEGYELEADEELVEDELDEDACELEEDEELVADELEGEACRKPSGEPSEKVLGGEVEIEMMPSRQSRRKLAVCQSTRLTTFSVL